MNKILLSVLAICFLSNIHAEYKNTNGKAINKSFSDLLEWRSNRTKPNLSIIKTVFLIKQMGKRYRLIIVHIHNGQL